MNFVTQLVAFSLFNDLSSAFFLVFVLQVFHSTPLILRANCFELPLMESVVAPVY